MMRTFFSLSLIISLATAPCFAMQKTAIKAVDAKTVTPMTTQTEQVVTEEVAATTDAVEDQATTKVDTLTTTTQIPVEETEEEVANTLTEEPAHE